MLDKLESCGKLSLLHCTLAKITAEKKNSSYNNEYSQGEVSSTITPPVYMLQYTKSQIQSAKQVLKEARKGFFVAVVFVKRYKITKKDILKCGQTVCLLATLLLGYT